MILPSWAGGGRDEKGLVLPVVARPRRVARLVSMVRLHTGRGSWLTFILLLSYGDKHGSGVEYTK